MIDSKTIFKETGNIVWNAVKLCAGIGLIAGLLIPPVSVTLHLLWDEFLFFWGLI